MTTTTAARTPWLMPGLALLAAVLGFAALGSRPLFNPDEGRYAEIPREMLAGGDWIIPHLNGVAYLEKPPLQYWATAASLALFGPTEFAARFYTALCAMATVVTVWLAARSLWSRAAAWRAAAVLASLLLFVVLGQLLTLDMSLTFYLTLALAAFLRAQGPARGRERWMLVAWAAVALGVMTKGPVAAVIPSAALVLYGLVMRDWALWRHLNARRGLAVFLAITVPWHWLAARRLPDFLDFFFVHEHLARYLTPSANREEPWWFFGAVFLLGSLPWTASALRVVAASWRRIAPQQRFQPVLFLWIWIVFVGVFFSLSDSKLIPYILPITPALALLIGELPVDVLRRDLVITAAVTLLAVAALVAFGLAGPRFIEASERHGYFFLLAQPCLEIAVLLGLSAVLVLFQRRDVTRAAMLLGTGWCLAGILMMRAAAAVAPIYSGVLLAHAAQDIPPNQPVFTLATYDQSLPFYWRRTLELAAYRGELDFGLRHAAGVQIPTVDAFIARWIRLSDAYVVMEIDMFDDLKRRGVPLRELARDMHRVLAARR